MFLRLMRFDAPTRIFSFVSGWAQESSFHFCIITSLLSTHLHGRFNPKRNVGLAYTVSIQLEQESELESHMTVPQKSKFLLAQFLVS